MYQQGNLTTLEIKQGECNISQCIPLALFWPGSRLCFPLKLSTRHPPNFLTTGLSSLSGSLVDSFSCSVIKASKSPRDIPLNTFKNREKKVVKQEKRQLSLKKYIYILLKQQISVVLIKVQILMWSTYCASLLTTEQNRWSYVWAVHKGDVFTGELQTRPGEQITSITHHCTMIKSAWRVWFHIMNYHV